MGKTKPDEPGDSPDEFDRALGDPADSRLFERESELQHVEAALGQLHLGVGGCILIRGPAGTGKTRLMEQAEALARATDLPHWYGHGGPTWRGEPLLTLREAVGGVEPPPSVPERRSELIDEIENRVARVPHLLAIDDLQSADPATLSTLGALAEHIEQFPLLLLLAYRSDVLPELPPGFEHATAIDLRPLTAPATEDYARHLLAARVGPALAAALNETGGTPLRIWLWLRDLEDRRALVRHGDAVDLADPGERPGNLTDLALARRREMMGAEAFELMRFVAVIGRRFRLEDLAAMAGLSPDVTRTRLQRLLEARGASEEGHWWLVRWPGMLGIVYDRMDPAERARLHRNYARLLQERAGSPVAVAEHLLAAAEPGDREAVEAARQGAEAVRARLPENAAHLLRQAAGLLPAGDTARNEVMVELIEAELAAGNPEEARRLGEEELEQAPAGPMRTRLQVTMLSVHEFGAGARLDDLATALLADPEVDRDVRRTVLARRALERVESGRLDEGVADAQRVLDESPEPDEVSSVAVTALAWTATTRGDPEEAVRLLRASPAAVPGPGPAAGLASVHEGLALCALDRFEEALEVFHASLRELDRAASLTRVRPLLLDGIAYARYCQGTWDDALADWQTVIRLSDRGMSATAARASRMRAFIAACRGDDGPARELRAARVAAAQRGETVTPDDLGLEAILLEHESDPAGATRAAQQALADSEARGDYSHLPFGLAWQLRFAREADLPDAEFADLVAPIADRLLGLARQWTTDSVVGAANLARGVRDQNAAALVQAAQRYRGSPRILDRAVGLDVCGEELLRIGQQDPGVEALMGALDSYRELDAEGLTDRVLRRLRELGVRRGLRRPRARPDAGWESLSQEELTVAALVSSGLSNPQIAEQMDLPRDRVAVAIEQVIAKLGVASRLELGLLVARRARDQERTQRRTPPESDASAQSEDASERDASEGPAPPEGPPEPDASLQPEEDLPQPDTSPPPDGTLDLAASVQAEGGPQPETLAETQVAPGPEVVPEPE